LSALSLAAGLRLRPTLLLSPVLLLLAPHRPVAVVLAARALVLAVSLLTLVTLRGTWIALLAALLLPVLILILGILRHFSLLRHLAVRGFMATPRALCKDESEPSS
jgi:hypothetical protein